MVETFGSTFNLILFSLCFSLPLFSPVIGDDVIKAANTTSAPIGAETSIDKLNAEICSTKRAGCCDEMYVADETELMKCFRQHHKDMPAKGDKDPAKLLKFLSCSVECLYKQKKYIGRGDSLNLKIIKSEAEKMFPSRPKERDYHIASFEHCRIEAANMMTMISMKSESKILLKDTCRPYFMFVFVCQMEYHKSHDCPYFRWKGKTKTPSETSCENAKKKCYKIADISV